MRFTMINEFHKKIIDFIQENRVNTTEVADALGKKGHLPNILPINSEQFRVGRVRCVFTANHSNYAVHEQIKHVEKDDVVIVFAHNCEGRSIIGELMAKYTLLYRRASAMIIQGTIRDVAAIKREKFSVWATGVSPIGCFNTISEPFPEDLRQQILNDYENGIAVCDDGGVVVIPPSQHNQEMLDKLERIEIQEDVWFFCLDALKWDTKKIVCDKAYLSELEHLPEIFKSKASSLAVPLDKK